MKIDHQITDIIAKIFYLLSMIVIFKLWIANIDTHGGRAVSQVRCVVFSLLQGKRTSAVMRKWCPAHRDNAADRFWTPLRVSSHSAALICSVSLASTLPVCLILPENQLSEGLCVCTCVCMWGGCLNLWIMAHTYQKIMRAKFLWNQLKGFIQPWDSSLPLSQYF